MYLLRMPLFTWTVFVTSLLMIFAFPALTVACGMLMLDRTLGMHFFTNGAGGNMMNYVNLFWLWGHPEVYILILPAFGVFSEVVAVFSQKRLFGYISLVLATMAIGLLSFTVWLHHFFTMGSSARVNSFFGTMTTIIAVPTGVKVFDWLITMFRGRIIFKPPMLYTIGFLVTFAIGGLSGVLLAMPPVDYLMHNTTFLIAHFHNMIIPGVLFGYLAGYMFWFPKAFGFKLNEKWGAWSFWCWIVGFYLAFMPLYVLGLLGMPRRMEHYEIAAWQPHLIIAAIGAFIIFLGIVCLGVQLVVSIRDRKRTGRSDRRSVERPLPGMADLLAGRALQFRRAAAGERHRRLLGHETARRRLSEARPLRRYRPAEEQLHRPVHRRRRLRVRIRHDLVHLVAGDSEPRGHRACHHHPRFR